MSDETDRRGRVVPASTQHMSGPRNMALLALLGSCAGLLASPGAAGAQAFEPISDDQRIRIVKHVVAENRPSVAAPSSIKLAAGDTLPLGIELFWMSPVVGLNRYRYAVVEGRPWSSSPTPGAS